MKQPEIMLIQKSKSSERFSIKDSEGNELIIDADIDMFPGSYNARIIKVKQALEFANVIYLSAKKELKNFFEPKEINLLLSVFNGNLFGMNDGLIAKELVIMNIEDAIYYEKLDEKFEIDFQKFYEKLNSLTEVHAMVLIIMMQEFWNESDSDKDTDVFIKEIFGIE